MIWWALIAACAAWVSFAYLGYPLVLAFLARFLPRPVLSADSFPALSVIIAVHDGAASLRQKLEETRALDYPGPREVIVASDGSTDGTEEIAESMADRGVRLVRNPDRLGKEAAQAAAIAQATGEVLVFTDLGARLEKDALRAIVRPFSDPSVGCVTSEDLVESEGAEGAYVKLEMGLRRLETRASTLVGLSGSFFAVRRSLCSPWPQDLASDFRCALESARRGYRAVAEPAARAHFTATREISAEWNRKVRTVQRGLAVLSAYRDLLHPRHGRVALSLWGHKVARFTSPFALLAMLGMSAAAEGPFATGLLAVQLAAYGIGAASLVLPALARWGLARLLGFFVLVNASMLVAWFHHLAGRRAVAWEPTRR